MKCLHAHVAHHLAGGDDAVGRWTISRLDAPPADDVDAARDSAARGHGPGVDRA